MCGAGWFSYRMSLSASSAGTSQSHTERLFATGRTVLTIQFFAFVAVAACLLTVSQSVSESQSASEKQTQKYPLLAAPLRGLNYATPLTPGPAPPSRCSSQYSRSSSPSSRSSSHLVLFSR